MNYNRTEPSGKTEKQRQSGEAELLAEILSRMDAKQKDGQSGSSQNSENSNATQSINLVELFYYMLTKVHVIVIGMVVGALALGMYASARVTPIYSATAKLYIIGTTGNSILSDLQIGSSLAMDYQEVFQTWEVHQMVNESLGTSYSYTDLEKMVTIDNPDDTHIISITVSNPDPQTAADIANAYADASKTFIAQTMDTDEPNTFSYALVPTKASGISTTGYIIRGILLGTVVACFWLVLNFLLDSRPKTPEDIMRYANIPTLAVFPANPNLSGDREHRKKERKL